MNVLFVNPPQVNTPSFPGPDMVFRSSIYAPLGMLYVATYLREKSDHDVRCFDYSGEGVQQYDAILPTLQAFQPDVVGFCSYTFTIYDLYQVAQLVRDELPDCRIVIGGPHIDVYPRETLAQPFVDAVVLGEGEETMLEICQRYDSGQDLDGVAGAWFKKGDQIVCNPDRLRIEDLNSIPLPDRRMSLSLTYRAVLNPAQLETSLVTSRGCPHKCTFCQVRARKYKYRSAENVVDEMAEIEAAGYSYVHIFDDTFNLFRRKVKEFCQEYIARGLTVQWAFRGRVDQVDEEMLALMKQANCVRCYYGVESGSDRTLEIMRKGITREDARRAFALTKAAGIGTAAFFMIGYPDETEQDIRQTIDFAKELDPDYAQILVTIPLPGTPLYDQAVAEGGISGDYFRDHTIDPDPDLKLQPWCRNLTDEQLSAWARRFYREFYFRPGYVWERIREVQSPLEFARKAGAAARLALYQVVRPASAA